MREDTRCIKIKSYKESREIPSIITLKESEITIAFDALGQVTETETSSSSAASLFPE